MNALKLIMLGTGSPYPDLLRGGASQVLVYNDLPILIDCGEGTTAQLMRAGIAPQDVHHLWLTHLHSDHLMGYLQFVIGGWHLGRRELTIVGPVGTRKFHETLIELFTEDIAYRTSLGFPSRGLVDADIIEVTGPGPVGSELPAAISAARMVHYVPTFAYRFEIGDKVVVFSGDTAPNENLVRLTQKADVLVNDCVLSVSEKYKAEERNTNLEVIWEKLHNEHCTPAQAATMAEKAGVKNLVLTHFLPGVNRDQAYAEATAAFSGIVTIGEDSQTIYI